MPLHGEQIAGKGWEPSEEMGQCCRWLCDNTGAGGLVRALTWPTGELTVCGDESHVMGRGQKAVRVKLPPRQEEAERAGNGSTFDS